MKLLVDYILSKQPFCTIVRIFHSLAEPHSLSSGVVSCQHSRAFIGGQQSALYRATSGRMGSPDGVWLRRGVV